MNCLQALILGLVQGATEFLPVSSSGHLIVVSEIIGVTPSLAYEIAMHVATLIAVVVYYRKKIIALIKKPLCAENGYIVAATLVTAVIAFILRKTVGDMQNPSLLPTFFLITAAILIIGGKFHPNGKMTLLKALSIGFIQGLAVVPGISRSGATVTAATCENVEKREAVEFSFLLSIPVIVGSAIFEFVGAPITDIATVPLLVGGTAAFIAGYAGIALFAKVAGKATTDVFAVYLVILVAVLSATGLCR